MRVSVNSVWGNQTRVYTSWSLGFLIVSYEMIYFNAEANSRPSSKL